MELGRVLTGEPTLSVSLLTFSYPTISLSTTMVESARFRSNMPTIDDINAIHINTVHACGQKETQWYDNPRGQVIEFHTEEELNKFFVATPATKPIIPSPEIFDSLSGEPPQSITALPSISECAVHLELLEVIHALRKRVISTQSLDKGLGLKPPTKSVFRRTYVSYRKYENRKHTVKDPTFPKRSQAKWPVFLKIAAMRFILWARKMEDLMEDRGGPHSEAKLPHLPPIG